MATGQEGKESPRYEIEHSTLLIIVTGVIVIILSNTVLSNRKSKKIKVNKTGTILQFNNFFSIPPRTVYVTCESNDLPDPSAERIRVDAVRRFGSFSSQ